MASPKAQCHLSDQDKVLKHLHRALAEVANVPHFEVPRGQRKGTNLVAKQAWAAWCARRMAEAPGPMVVHSAAMELAVMQAETRDVAMGAAAMLLAMLCWLRGQRLCCCMKGAELMSTQGELLSRRWARRSCCNGWTVFSDCLGALPLMHLRRPRAAATAAACQYRQRTSAMCLPHPGPARGCSILLVLEPTCWVLECALKSSMPLAPSAAESCPSRRPTEQRPQPCPRAPEGHGGPKLATSWWLRLIP